MITAPSYPKCLQDISNHVTDMSLNSALRILDDLAACLKQVEPIIKSKGWDEYYQRDMGFVERSKSALQSGDQQRIRWVFDEMRNLSQGFGSYCPDQKALDMKVSRLYSALRWTWAIKLDL